jgi:hypothetical protein
MNRAVPTIFLCAALPVLCGTSAGAGEADVISVDFERQGDKYTFHVTVRHGDTGWQHYADRWEILSGDGDVIATRTLLHPHVDEQPFTRSRSGISLPPGTTTVTVRAHDNVDGYGGKTVKVNVEDGAGGS